MTTPLNRVKMNLVTAPVAGTGSFILNAPQAAFISMDDAGAVDGDTYTYLALDGNNWEIGAGVYDTPTTTLTRSLDTDPGFASSTGASIVFGANTIVSIIQSAYDFLGGAAGSFTNANITVNDRGQVVAASNGAGGSSGLYGPPWTVPVHADYTNFNLGTATITDNAFGIAINTALQAFALRGMYKAAPGATFDLYARIENSWVQPVNNQRWGVLIGNSTTGRFGMFGYINNANGDQKAYSSTWSNAFAFNGGGSGALVDTAPLSAKWLKVSVGAATVTFFIGDGYNWVDTGITETLATYINNGGGAIDRIGIGFALGAPMLFSVNSLSTVAPVAGGGGQL